jgi:FKBP-type peptidyl-prolyl cis-trans isomerase FkpA
MKMLPKNTLRLGVFALILLGCNVVGVAQEKSNKKRHSEKMGSEHFTTLPNGLQYWVAKHGNGTRKPAFKDHIEMNIHVHIGDSVIFDSRKMLNDKPVPYAIQMPKGRGDLIEGLMTMVVGDSTVFAFSVDSMKKENPKQPTPPWAKPGDIIEYNVVLLSVRSEEEEKKYEDEMAAKQNVIDDKLLREYFARNNLQPMKTTTGLYYVISRKGEGEHAKMGESATVNYTGKLMNGQAFDSNTDSAFKHPQPLAFTVGKAIKGWDEGLQLLNKGAKATFYIPSSLAYGARDQRNIPANSILIFDVELLDIKDPSQQAKTDDKMLQDYFAKNNIKATRTPSGLYYVIRQKGLGPMARPGKGITMNYTGKLMDGTAFDSNMDPKFGHVQPFTFRLGEGQVIKGWDEGVQLLQMGSKATFYIPSGLAYGESGNQKIPPNSNLIFDVEVSGINK